MEHVVFFPAPDGTPAFRRVAGLEDAVRFVEHLRNVENVSGASVYALTEVPLAFKAWYRVEVPVEQNANGSESPEAPGTRAQPSSEPISPEPVAAPVLIDTPAARPATVAETIETYAHAGASSFEMPDAGSGIGSGTGIVVPDQPLVAVDQFGLSPLALSPSETPERRVDTTQPGDAQVLEPAFGAKRERGMGFFAR